VKSNELAQIKHNYVTNRRRVGDLHGAMYQPGGWVHSAPGAICAQQGRHACSDYATQRSIQRRSTGAMLLSHSFSVFDSKTLHEVLFYRHLRGDRGSVDRLQLTQHVNS
jgi:hypothetical protein